MLLYVRDPEVDRLVATLAGIRNKTKTEAVRRALINELESEGARPSLAEAGVAYAREFRAKAGAAAGMADKAFIDGLYEGP